MGVPSGRRAVTWVALAAGGTSGWSRGASRISGVMGAAWGAGPGARRVAWVALARCRRATSACNKEGLKKMKIKINREKTTTINCRRINPRPL